MVDDAVHPSARVGAIVVAAGASSRMGVDKLLVPLAGIPVLAHTLNVFQASEAVEEVALVLGQANLVAGHRLVEQFGWSKVRHLCAGGARRQDSVWQGLCRLSHCRWVVIHDGARPFVTDDLINRGIAEAKRWGAAVAAVPIRDTIKVAGPDGCVGSTPDRATLWSAQTPQVFDYRLLHDAYQTAADDVTDDASLVERQGHRVRLYTGSFDNIKITTPEDLELAEVILRRRGVGAGGHRL